MGELQEAADRHTPAAVCGPGYQSLDVNRTGWFVRITEHGRRQKA
jgi:hypothetical protein